MSSSKLRKISKIVKEITIQSSQSRYDISGLDLSLCKFYYRVPQNLFKDLASGDYTIDTSNSQQSLIIQNNEVISSGEAIQVCYEMDLSSSKYEVDFEVDINRLTTSYNELVEDVHTLWEYIRKTGMIADDTTIDLILPQLDKNEVWVKTEDGYKGMALDDVEQSIKDIIDKYSQQKIEEIKKEITTHADSEIQRATNEITDVKDTSIQNIKDQEKTSTNNMISEINKHTEKKKVELNDHEQLKEQELNDLHEQLSTRLQELIDGAVMDKGVLPINSDWHLLDRGNYYVIDLFNSNYKNHPINIVNQNEGQGIVMVGIADDGKTKIIRYYSTSKRMFFQVLTQSNIWSEWAVLGGGSGGVYEIVQNNHGFNFNAVSLDGLTSRWVLADKNTGADAVAIKIDDNRFQLLFNGQGVIPTSSRDDKGNEFIYDEYYFLSNTVNGAFQKDKPTYGLFQPLFHTRMVENKLVADVQIGDIHDLTQHIVDSETIKEYGIATEKDLLNKLDKGNVSSEYDTAEKIEYQIKKLQANTIEDLIAMRFLKVGDIVELLGYYTAGDGAGHKRIIKAEDDGSGVQLSNNLWACIVHNGEVNVSWFGAKGDGITDDTAIFKKAISYVETNEYKLAFLKRKYYITDLITFYGNYDFNGATIKVIQGNKNTSFLGFYGSNFEISDTKLTLEEINLGNFSKLKPYGKCKVYINSEDIFLEKRDHPLGSAVYKTDYILVNNGVGEYQIFNDYANTTRVDLVKVDSRQKYIKNLNLEITLNSEVTDNYFAPVVKFWRYDNTLVDNIKINITNNDVQNKPTTIFGVFDTYNIEFNRINSETLLATKQGTYIFNIEKTIKATINNSYIYNKDEKEYWGATGTNLLKDFTIKNSTINRMDSHTFGGGSYRIENSDVKAVCVMGDMDLIIENSIIDDISFRKDYNNFFTGNINVKNTTFKTSGTFCVYHSSFFGDTSLFSCKKIYLENVNFLSNAFLLYFDNVKKIFIPRIEINSMEIHGRNFAFILAQKSINLKILNDVVTFKLVNQKNIELSNYNFKIINTTEDGYNNIFNQNFLLRVEYENLKKIILRTERIKKVHFNVKNSEIISIDTLESSKTSNTSLVLSNCIINPIGLEDADRDSSYQLHGVKYLLFDHCKFEIPQNITPDKAPTSHRLSFLNSTMIECPTEYINCEYTQTTLDYLESKKSDSKYSNMIAKFLTGTNALPKYGLRYFSKKIKDSIEGQVNAVEQLNTLYHMEKMKQEGVYNDYISYMDEKTVYDKQQRKLEQDRQLAYEEALKENPDLTYEEFMSVQPMTLNLVEEPQPSQALQEFMEKYL